MPDAQEFDFSKPNESIHFVGPYVIKYFADAEQVSQRIVRAKDLEGFTPPITFSAKHLFGYIKVSGHTLYQQLDLKTATSFFNWCQQHFWNPGEIKLDPSAHASFSHACRKFYHQKTADRINQYWSQVKHKDQPSIVNGYPTPSLSFLLKQIDWTYLASGTPSRFHGDMQFDNVLTSTHSSKPFTLLDWRGNFGGLTQYGDLYYDLAKLYGGLIIAYHEIKKNNFLFYQRNQQVTIKLPLPDQLQSIRYSYEQFLTDNQYDLQKIKLLAGLIFLNMSPLHQQPFNNLLHHLGKIQLTQLLSPDATHPNL